MNLMKLYEPILEKWTAKNLFCKRRGTSQNIFTKVDFGDFCSFHFIKFIKFGGLVWISSSMNTMNIYETRVYKRFFMPCREKQGRAGLFYEALQTRTS